MIFLDQVVGGGTTSVQAGLLAPTIFYASIAYAVAKHDLFDVDRIVRQSVIYGTLTVLIATVYAALLSCFRGWRGWRREPREWLPGAIAASLVAAAGDEWHQGAVPGRSPDLLDLLADSLGIALAAFAWACWARRPRHRSLLRTIIPPAPAPSGGPCVGSASPRRRRSSDSR